MAVSAIGQGVTAPSLRYALATALVFAAFFYFFHGPPLTERFARSAWAECNRQTGSTYRTFVLEWRTTTYDEVNRPHWVCHDLRDPRDTGTDLGWWTGL